MILLKKITLKDFLSHENTVIEFQKNEKILLDGNSGSGKSSILEGIVFALYGISRSGIRDMIRKGTKKGLVCLELIRDEEIFIITRSVTTGGKHLLDIVVQQANGDRSSYPLSGIRELQNFIDHELIGASYLLFINSAVYLQGNADSFVAQTAPKRKELLLEIVKAEDYEKYYENARKELSRLENEQNMLSGQSTELEANLAAISGHIESKEVYIKEILDNNAKILILEPEVKALDKKRTEFLNIEQELKLVTYALSDATEEEKIAKEQLEVKRNRISNKPMLLEAASRIEETKEKLIKLQEYLASSAEQETKRNEYYARKPIVTDRSSEISRYVEQIEAFRKKEICPSGDTCPYQKSINDSVDYIDKNIKELKDLMVKEAVALSAWLAEEDSIPPVAMDIRKIVADIAGLTAEVRKAELARKDLEIINEVELEIPGIENKIKDLGAQIVELKQKQNTIKTSFSPEEVAKIDKELVEKKYDLDILHVNVTRAEVELEYIEDAEAELKEVQNRITSIRKNKIEITEKARKIGMVKDAFGSKGIETIVIDYLLPKLEDRINQVLSKLSDFRVRLDTQRKSADGESMVEGLFITILNELNEEMPFETYSGGEKLKIAVSISESLATLQKVGFRLFDETIFALDENSLESFTIVMEGLLKQFNQVLMVSHIQAIKDLFPRKIDVRKYNGISIAT